MSSQPALRLVTSDRLDDIREAIAEDIASSSAWRSQKLAEHPDDGRNGEAVACFDKLEASVADIQADLLLRYEALWERDGCSASEAWSQILRSVGFHSAPPNAQCLVEDLLSEMEPRLNAREEEA